MGSGAGAYVYNPSGSAWTFSPQGSNSGSGVSGNNSNFTSGDPNAPQGSQVAFVQGTGTISQAVAGWAAGSYQISFDAIQRASYNSGGEDFEVLVDGNVVATFKPSGTSYQVETTPAFTVAAGSHTVSFVGLDSVGGDNTAFIDAIGIAVASSPTTPAVGDASFEAVSAGSSGYVYNPSGSAWTFSPQGSNTGSGVTGNNSPFTSGDPNAPQGSQVAFLQSAGTISQAISFAAAGSYQISFDAIQRGNNNHGGENFEVLVDGNVVGTFQPSGSSYQLETTAAFTVGAGSHTITFEGLDSVGGDNTAFLDAVSIAVASPVAATYVGDSGFEAVAEGSGSSAYTYDPTGSAWSFAGDSGLSGNNSNFTSGNPNAPQGSQVAFLQDGGSISQTINFAAAGSYQLTFDAAQRENFPSDQSVQVLVDGTVVGTITPSGTTYGLYATSAFSVSAGAHTVTLRGTSSSGYDTAFIDAVSLAGLATPTPAGASAVRWTVYDGQTPLLDFNGFGQQTARYLSVPGAIDELLARQTASGVAWYLDDREGSVGDIINDSGTVLDHIDYTAYGQVAAESAPAQGDRFKYAGMEFDAAIGLYYDRARYYDPAAGRFIKQDPLSFAGGDDNLYRYVGNNTANDVDPEGLQGPARGGPAGPPRGGPARPPGGRPGTPPGGGSGANPCPPSLADMVARLKGPKIFIPNWRDVGNPPPLPPDGSPQSVWDAWFAEREKYDERVKLYEEQCDSALKQLNDRNVGGFDPVAPPIPVTPTYPNPPGNGTGTGDSPTGTAGTPPSGSNPPPPPPPSGYTPGPTTSP